MRYALAALAGMASTFCIFAGGVAFAIAYLSADRVPVENVAMNSDLHFTSEPIRVDAANQKYERIDGIHPVSPEPAIEVAAAAPAAPVEEIELPELDGEQALSDEHVAWCSQRYRSYRPETNSYTPYSGGSRECVSPYTETASQSPIEDDAQYLEAFVSFHDDSDMTNIWAGQSSHIESCFARYRSYRPEDNSYQPYGGGPRRQCQ